MQNTLGSHVVRRWCAALTAIVGFMNIVSALYPALPYRTELLRDVLPLHVIRASQTATVLAGFFLILLADGLRKRRRRAMQMTIAVLLFSTVLNLAKGLDFEEAAVALWLSGGLITARSEFPVRSPFAFAARSLQPTISFVLLYFGYLIAGFLILRRSIVPAPSLGGVLAEPFRLLFDASPYHYVGAQAQWFQRSVAWVGGTALLFGLVSLLRPLIPKRDAGAHDLQRVRGLVELYGADTLSYFALQDGRRYFFNRTNDAVLSYKIQGSVALVGGNPIGAPRGFRDLLSSFVEFAEAYGLEPCFLGVTQDMAPLFSGQGMHTLKIGEEALVDLASFDVTALKRKVRRAVRHIEDLGITIQSYSAADVPEGVRAQMGEIWSEWIATKGGAQRGFSMTLGRLPRPTDEGCEVIVASQGDGVMGYLCLVPAQCGRAWSLDAMRRRPETPNGLTEALVVRAAETYRQRGFETISLNFATLSNSTNEIDSRALEATRRFLYDNLSGYYQLKTLYQFNSKFEPRWESRYVAFRAVRRMPKLAFAIVQSEDPIRIPALSSRIER
ncbi:MAG: phosphatidylglycerol lysyltransferase domain-containing protein [Chloroflexota bacterium]